MVGIRDVDGCSLFPMIGRYWMFVVFIVRRKKKWEDS